VTTVTAQGRWTSYFLTTGEADPPFVEQQETTMNNDLLNDEHLDIVAGGKPGDHTGGGTGGGGGKGTGGGDGLGWLRNLFHTIFG
jgi:hypothetical protein